MSNRDIQQPISDECKQEILTALNSLSNRLDSMINTMRSLSNTMDSMIEQDYISDTETLPDLINESDLIIDQDDWGMVEDEIEYHEEPIRVVDRQEPRPNNAFTAEYNFFDPNYEIKRNPISDEKLGYILDYNDRVLNENPDEKKLIKKPTDCIFCIKCITEWLVIPECKHAFHQECLLEWFKYGKTCPLCRKN